MCVDVFDLLTETKGLIYLLCAFKIHGFWTRVIWRLLCSCDLTVVVPMWSGWLTSACVCAVFMWSGWLTSACVCAVFVVCRLSYPFCVCVCGVYALQIVCGYWIILHVFIIIACIVSVTIWQINANISGRRRNQAWGCAHCHEIRRHLISSVLPRRHLL